MRNKSYFAVMLIFTCAYICLGLYMDYRDNARGPQRRREQRERMQELRENWGELRAALRNKATETVSKKDWEDTLEIIATLEHKVMLLQEDVGDGSLMPWRIDWIGLVLVVQLIMAGMSLKDPKDKPITLAEIRSEIGRLNDELRDGLDRTTQKEIGPAAPDVP